MFDQDENFTCDERLGCCWGKDDEEPYKPGAFTQWTWHAQATLRRARAVVGRALSDLRRIAVGEPVCNPSAERDEEFNLCPEAWRMVNRSERSHYRIGYGMACSAFDMLLQAGLTRERVVEELIAFVNGPLVDWEEDYANARRTLPPIIRPN